MHAAHLLRLRGLHQAASQVNPIFALAYSIQSGIESAIGAQWYEEGRTATILRRPVHVGGKRTACPPLPCSSTAYCLTLHLMRLDP